MDSGLMVAYVLIQDANGGASVSQADLQDYADEYGLSCPVLADGAGALWANGYVSSTIPSFVLIRWDGEVLLIDDWNTIDARLGDAMPSYGGPDGWPEDWI
jgi:hypothetical protein